MSKAKPIETKQVGGDRDWWTYGAIFLRVFEQSDHVHRELWNVLGLEEEYPDNTGDDDDDPGLKVTVYRAALPDKDDAASFMLSEDWFDWPGVVSYTGQDPDNYEHDYELLRDAASYHGWLNFDGYPCRYTQSELVRILDLKNAEMY